MFRGGLLYSLGSFSILDKFCVPGSCEGFPLSTFLSLSLMTPKLCPVSVLSIEQETVSWPTSNTDKHLRFPEDERQSYLERTWVIQVITAPFIYSMYTQTPNPGHILSLYLSYSSCAFQYGNSNVNKPIPL